MLETMKKMSGKQWVGFAGSILATCLVVVSFCFAMAYMVEWFGASYSEHPNAARMGWCWLVSTLGMLVGILLHRQVFKRLWVDSGL